MQDWEYVAKDDTAHTDGGAGAPDAPPQRETVNVREISAAVLEEQYRIWGERMILSSREGAPVAELTTAFVNWKVCYFELQRRQEIHSVFTDQKSFLRLERMERKRDPKAARKAKEARTTRPTKGQGKLW